MKPQSREVGLDDEDRAPHPWAMTASDKAPKDPTPAREAKLAEALRANLRRRKAGATPKASSQEDGKSTQKD